MADKVVILASPRVSWPIRECLLLEDDGTEFPINADEVVQSMDAVLLELIQSHPAFDGEVIDVNATSCSSEETAQPYAERIEDAGAKAKTQLKLYGLTLGRFHYFAFTRKAPTLTVNSRPF